MTNLCMTFTLVGAAWHGTARQVRKGKAIIKMVRDGKEAAKKLLDKSISEFQTNMKNSKEDRSLAMISDADAAKRISALLRSQLPEEEKEWENALVQDSWWKRSN